MSSDNPDPEHPADQPSDPSGAGPGAESPAARDEIPGPQVADPSQNSAATEDVKDDVQDAFNSG